MRKTAYLLVVVALVMAAPAFAQGPFNDVPTDHWAYDAVNTLQKDGIVIGFPDGTFGGKRAMSRYEFATAIARLLPMITTGDFATKSDLQNAIAGIKIPEQPDLSKFATKADLDAIKKLVDEFRDEIAALGVDVDALKRDVAALCARVDALEAEQKRVRITGDVNVFGISTAVQSGIPIDLDQRNLGTTTASGAKKDTIGRNIGVVKDFDLTITGRVSQTTTAVATINYGDYLNYLGFVDDYVGGVRATSKTPVASPLQPGAFTSLEDTFFPYYLYINTGLCKGSITVGRFPLQWTPYTLRKIDVDSYTSILKTDDGNYPVDGIKAAYNFGGVDLALFAVKNDENTFLVNGLTGQPTLANGVRFNDIGGASVGGLTDPITQTAGARLTFGTPWKGVLGLTYYQAWSETNWAAFVPTWDQAQVYGADLNIPFCNLGFVASWTKSNALASDRAAAIVKDLDNNNTAWDGKLTGTFGKLGAAAGYKQIERNFAAAGAWDKIGRWTNPVDVKGPYVDFTYPIARKLRVALNGEFLNIIDSQGVPGLNKDDQIIKAEGGLQWGVSKTNSLDLGYQWVQYTPDNAVKTATESYLTVGWAHQMSANAGMKLGYQFVGWDRTAGAANNVANYGNSYRGGLAVAQFGVSF